MIDSYTGKLSCLRPGISTVLPRSMARARAMRGRVVCGILASFPSPLAGEGGEHRASRDASRVRGQARCPLSIPAMLKSSSMTGQWIPIGISS